jgi:Concanavalin A-like lectin/glucanases superfamily/F5/8 type C domain/NPCBM-associated, NEW3 domain of alpha-galactosidase/Trehalase
MTRRPNIASTLLLALSVCAGVTAGPVVALSAPADAAAAAASPVSSSVGAGTHFIDEDAKLVGFNDPGWYEANIPFLDIPDQQIEDVYYYRWRTWKEHLRYTNPTDGWISTEFLDCCSYAAPYQAINAAAGFHIAEGRWVRDQSYTDNYIRFWLQGPGQQAQDVNPDAPDWAHEYSFWAATAALQDADVTGDVATLRTLQSALIRQYRGWDNHFDSTLGLYWQVPVWDAKEYSPATYESSNHFAGVRTFRPSINAYQYGDALAIAEAARLNGDTATQAEYLQRAAALKANAHKWLWDPTRGFWYDIVDENNPAHQRLDTREETGFVPWQFDLAEPSDSVAWAQMLDPQGFAAPYGPTTVERRSPWFMSEAGQGCCHWDGPSWPYSTAQELTGLANLLDEYPAQDDITPADYDSLLHTFAATQNRNGVPYVAEAHDPDQPNWIYDGFDHSEDYNHSSFDDLVISGLIGLRPSLGANLQIKPLTPATWDHFALENVPYHGHNLTVIWDRDGSHYGQGPGMKAYVDGTLVRSSPTVRALTVPVGPAPQDPGYGVPGRLVNDAANPLRTGYPRPITSYTWPFDDPWNALDGKVWFHEVPEDTRWTNYSSPNAQDYYGVDFGVPTPVSDVRFYGYDDGGGVRPAAAYTLQYWTGDSWTDVPDQVHAPERPVGNGLNRVTFPELTTARIRLLFANPPGAYVGVTELSSWSPSSGDASVVVTPQASDQTVHIDGPTQVSITVTNRTNEQLLHPTVSVAVPDGWSAVPASTADVAALPPGKSMSVPYTVTRPTDERGITSDLVATANYTEQHGVARTTHTRQPLLVACDETGTRVGGRLGNAVQLCGQGQYVNLPDGIVSSLHDFTVSTWVKPAANPQWSRVFDFGSGTNSYMFLSLSNGSGLRFAITTDGGNNEQRLDTPSALPLNTWSHVAVTLAGTTATIWVNGMAVVTRNDVTLAPVDLGHTTQDYIGKSQYNDPYADATFDDFQIYDHALTPSQIADLANGAPGAGNVASYPFDEAGGATVVDASGNGRNATIV